MSTAWDLSSKQGRYYRCLSFQLFLPPSCSLSLGTLLTGWFKREHYSAGDEIISFLSSTALFPLLMGSPAASRHVGRDVSCVRSSSLLTCVWPFVPAAEGAAAFSIKWLVIWGSRGVELSSVYAQFSAISERLMFAWVTHTMGRGNLIFSGWAF